MALVFFAQTWLLRSAGVKLIRAPLLAGGVFGAAAGAAAWLEVAP